MVMMLLRGLLTACVLVLRFVASEAEERDLQFFGDLGYKQASRPLAELLKFGEHGSVTLAPEINPDEAETLRQAAVNLLGALYQQEIMPFKTKNYAQTKLVIDRAPIEQFLDIVTPKVSSRPLYRCLEWGPYFRKWKNVTQPYHSHFPCQESWTFMHDAKHPRRTRTFRWGRTIYGELDRSLDDQGLSELTGKFDLVILPQTLQYVKEPYLSVKVLYDLLAPGGFLIFSTPFLQVVMTYPTDYYRFTAEANELLLEKTGFKVLESFVGGNPFVSICAIMSCGQKDLDAHNLATILKPRGGEYSHTGYMLSIQLAQKPEPFMKL